MPQWFIDSDIAKAQTLDTDFYTSQQYFEHAREKLFATTWQLAGHTGQIPDTGDTYPFILLKHYLHEPLLLTRDNDGNINCLSNVCTHRGNILVTTPCKQTQLRCRYHGRTFSLDGTFTFMPEFKEVQNFPTPKDNLHKLPQFTWGNLLFTTLASTITPYDILGDMIARMHWFPIRDLVFMPHRSKDYTVKAHWALYCENYLEGLHIPFVHPGLNQELDFSEYTTELFRYSSLQLGIGKHPTECFVLPPSSPDHGRNIAAYYFWVFPNMMFNFYPWGLSVNIVKPVDKENCTVSFLTFVSDESKLDTGAGSGLDAVELEDEAVVENVQRGTQSRFYHQGRYSATREQGVHHFHTLIAEFMNR